MKTTHTDRVYLTGDDITRVFNDADPPPKPGDRYVWIGVFSISAAVFGLECYYIAYPLLRYLFRHPFN